MSALLVKYLEEVNKYDAVERVDVIPNSNRKYIDHWKLSTEIEVNGVRHDIDFLIGFPVDFPYSLPDFYFQSLEFGYLPHVESKNGKLCLEEDGVSFSVDNPLGLILFCIKRAKRLIQDGACGNNVADFLAEINSYWSRNYNDEPDLKETIIFYGEIPAINCELSALSYAVPLLEYHEKNGPINTLLYLGNMEPFNGYISEHFQHNSKTALFLTDVKIKERTPYNISFAEFLTLLTKDGKKRARNFLNRHNGGDLYFKLTDNRIAGVRFEKAELKKNGFRLLKPCNVYEGFGNNEKNRQRLYGFVYTKKHSAERTAGKLMEKMNFLVAGLGSVGSNLIHFLLGYNNVSFTLVDKDFLTTDNLGRHLLGFSYVNLLKAHGVTDYIKLSNLEADVNPVASTLQEYINTDFNKLNDFTALFLCTGDIMTEKYIFHAIEGGKINVPIFNLWLEPFGAAGHLVYVNSYQCTFPINIYNSKSSRYIHNIIKEEAYERNKEKFVRHDAGCNGSYTLYSGNDVLLMLSAFYPIITRLLKKPLQSKCYRWVGNKDYLLKQGIELNIDSNVSIGTIQEFML